jgi:hypothetical protein
VIKSSPQPLHQRRNPADIEQIKCYLHLQQNITKVAIGTDTLKQLALETTNIRHPQDKWSHISTHGCQMDGYINAGTGIYCELFSYYSMCHWDNTRPHVMEKLKPYALHYGCWICSRTSLRELLSFLT